MEIDALKVRIEADLGDIRRELRSLNNQVNKTEQEVKGSFTAIGNTMRAVVTVALAQQAARFGSMFARMASDVEEMQSKSSVVFGQFVDDVRQELDEFATVVGRSRFELEGMAASIQDTFVPLGIARGEAAKLSTELTRLAVDVGAFNNVADAEVMRAFQSAIVGNHETVRQFGIIITQASLQAELFNIGINKNIKDATEQEKVMARLSIITKGTGDAHGTAAREAESYAGQSRALDAALSDLGVTAGQILAPGMSTLQSVFIAAAEGANDLLEVLNKPGGLANAIREIAEDTGVFGDLLKPDLNTMILDGRIVTLEATKKEFEELVEEFKSLDEGPELEAVAERLEEVIDILERFKKVGADVDFTSPLRVTVGEGVVMPRPRPDFGPATAPAVMDPDALKLQDQFADKVKDLKNEIALLSAEFNGSTEAQLAFLELQQQFPGLADESIKKLVEERFALADKIELQQAERDILNDLQEANRDLLMEQQGVSDVERELIELRRQAGVVMFENEEEIRKLIEANKKLRDEMALSEEMEASFKQAMEGAGNAISNTLANALVEGEFSLQSFRGIFKDFVKQMIAEAIRLYIIRTILGAIFGPAGGAVAGSAATPGQLFAPSGSGIGPITPSASGGAMSPRRPYLVGERGPELIIPHSASTIMNSNNTRSALGNTSPPIIVNQSINVSTGVQETVRAEVINLMPAIRESAAEAVSSRVQRGGNYQRAIRG